MKKLTITMIALLLVLAGCGSKNIMKDYEGFDKKDNHFVTKNYSDMVEDMVNKVPGFYYIGFPDCPWCIDLVPHLEEVLTESNVNAMYMNVRDPQFKNNDALKEQYIAFLKTFADGVANNGSSPFVFVITEDGSIKGHTGTAPTHDAQTSDMTDTEVEYLKVRLNALVDLIK